MRYSIASTWVLISMMAGAGMVAAAQAADQGEPEMGEPGAAVQAILESLADENLEQLLSEALDRNPGIAKSSAAARAAATEATRAGTLPDPMLGASYFVDSPETRVGPQEWSLNLTQRLPWLGKLAALERSQGHLASAQWQRVEAERLRLITEIRRLLLELDFVQRHAGVTRELLAHLIQHEEIARTRYATGSGPGQGVIKLQAEITRVERNLLDLERRQVSIAARINGLRERPAETPLPRPKASEPREPLLDEQELWRRAVDSRPEIAAVDSDLARAESMTVMANKQGLPDFLIGLSYVAVGDREDPAGIAMPPPDNGQDVFGIQGGVSIPIWRQSIRAGEDAARHLTQVAHEDRRRVMIEIDASISELVPTLELYWRQLRLLEDVLIPQAEESLQSAEAGYITGTLNALDLLDAEHVLFEARIAVLRARTDYAATQATLEGVVGGPLGGLGSLEEEPS